jgi:hypothetical protein
MRGLANARRWAVIVAAVGLVASACGGGGTSTTSSAPPAASSEAPATSEAPPATSEAPPTSVYDVDLKAAGCPDTIVLQTDWFPEVEHGASYQLIGPGGTIDAGAGTYTGPLKDTGVQMEIRAGGPFIGFSSPTAQMYSDDSIFIAFADTGNQIQTYATTPAIGIVAPLEIGPQILMYDPDTYDFASISDVKDSGATVLYFESAAFIDYFVGTGQLDDGQLDASYDGSPARFVAEGGKLVQQGFATNEPYTYENVITDWGKPVSFLLMHNFGWTIYQSNIVVRPETITNFHDCLAALVPMYQQAQIDYINDPGPVNDTILQIVTEMNTFWVDSTGLNDDADQKMRDLGIVGNGPDSIIGNYDFDRLQTFFDTFVPIETGKGVDIPDDLTPDKLATNEFIDPNIGL